MSNYRQGGTILGVTGQHGLDRHAHRFHALDGRPTVAGGEKVKADDAVGIDVRVHGYFWLRVIHLSHESRAEIGRMVFALGNRHSITGANMERQ